MNLLLLGGTGFLSGAVVAEALAAGHHVTTVTRGRAGEPSEGVTALHADRDVAEDLAAAVADLEPDAVIDTCGYQVAGAHAAAQALGDVPAYAFVSSISAYRDWPPGPLHDEQDPTWPPDADTSEYGPMKAESERVLGRALGDRLLAVRAGLIIGRGDPTRRLTSWLHRIATQDRVVVPEDLEQAMSFVDVRDLATWIVETVERGVSGPVNAIGPADHTTFDQMLEACRTAVADRGGAPAELVAVSEVRLLAAGVEPWRDLPFWLPRDVAPTAWDLGTSRAWELGLRSRPIDDSVADAWRWVQESGFEHPPHPATEVEARLLSEV
ncbi:MAG: NAD-dependent epimerase/dehydratase [Actinotalea sp.]|nr:NAD-dependent epimerase/dehydratase [Actinotalea sp.]